MYSTYLGGSGVTGCMGIAVDSAGSAYVTGGTGSTDFPLRTPFQVGLAGDAGAFVTKLSPGLPSSVIVTAVWSGGARGGTRLLWTAPAVLIVVAALLLLLRRRPARS